MNMDAHITASPSRNVGIDIIRTMAVFCVIGVHALPQTVPLSMGTGRESATIAMRIVVQFIQMTCQLGVPLFIAITGYLMLSRDYSGQNLARFIKHNFLPLLFAFEFWNIVTYIVDHYYIISISTLRTAIFSSLFLSDTPMGHMWYLQMITGVYLALPLIASALQKIKESGNNKYLLPFTFLFVIYQSIVPTALQLANLLGYNTDFQIKYYPAISNFSWILCPLLIGYASRQGFFKRVPKFISVLLLLLSLLLLTADGYCWLMYSTPDKPALPPFPLNDTFILFALLAIFIVVENVQWNDVLPSIVTSSFKAIAKQSFGIYIIHFPIVMFLTVHGWHPTMNNWANCLIYFLASFIIAFAASAILSKIPIVGQWVFLIKNSNKPSFRRPRHAAHAKRERD
ncbi:acyltransferase [Bifidobacterium vespertilionis]|uniref:acyltransferase n=1 Tax=Bifidobacterium vespertilionis TaxID=2562524 RepID=UPI0030B86585